MTRAAAALLLLAALASAPRTAAAQAGAPPAAAPAPAQPAPAAATPGAPLERTSELGPVRVRVSLEPAAPRIGDALALRIEATAEPGVELLMPEFGEALGRFQIADFAPSDALDAQGRSVASQLYHLQTASSGAQRIPPIAVEFVDRRPGQKPAPEGQDAYELLSEPLEFEVASGLAPGAAAELREALGPLPPLGSSRGAWLAAGALLTALGAGAVFALRAWRAQRERAQQRSAYDVAQAALGALLAGGRPQAAQMDGFFVALSAILRQYLEARFRLRSPELTTEEFLEVMLGSPELGAGHQALLRELLQRADLVKFAHHVPNAEVVEASIDAVQRFLRETREETQPGAAAAGAREAEVAHA